LTYKNLIANVNTVVIKLWLVISLSLFSEATLANEEDNQAKLTAAFIYQITKFVKWPSIVQNVETQTISLCLLGDFKSSTLRHFQLLENKVSQGKKIKLNVITSSIAKRENIRCEIFFAQQSEWQNYTANELEALSKQSLLIGSTREFLQNGGMMSLVLVKNKMKIFFNADVIAKTTIKIESRLKALATML
jgi:hypothetical protein